MGVGWTWREGEWTPGERKEEGTAEMESDPGDGARAEKRSQGISLRSNFY